MNTKPEIEIEMTNKQRHDIDLFSNPATTSGNIIPGDGDFFKNDTVVSELTKHDIPFKPKIVIGKNCTIVDFDKKGKCYHIIDVAIGDIIKAGKIITEYEVLRCDYYVYDYGHNNIPFEQQVSFGKNCILFRIRENNKRRYQIIIITVGNNIEISKTITEYKILSCKYYVYDDYRYYWLGLRLPFINPFL